MRSTVTDSSAAIVTALAEVTEVVKRVGSHFTREKNALSFRHCNRSCRTKDLMIASTQISCEPKSPPHQEPSDAPDPEVADKLSLDSFRSKCRQFKVDSGDYTLLCRVCRSELLDGTSYTRPVGDFAFMGAAFSQILPCSLDKPSVGVAAGDPVCATCSQMAFAAVENFVNTPNHVHHFLTFCVQPQQVDLSARIQYFTGSAESPFGTGDDGGGDGSGDGGGGGGGGGGDHHSLLPPSIISLPPMNTHTHTSFFICSDYFFRDSPDQDYCTDGLPRRVHFPGPIYLQQCDCQVRLFVHR